MMSIMKTLQEEKQLFANFISAKKRKIEQDIDENFKKKLILIVYEALENLEKVLAENNSCSNLSFYIGYLKLAIGLENEAVENFNTAIDKSDDNNALHYIWKGIALCMCQNYDQALNEFRTALSIDPEDYQAALYKGRCYLYRKDIEKAFYAFKDFMNGGQEEREIKYWLGNFFFANGLNSHANQSYIESITIKQTEECVRELTRCYIVEKNLIKALDWLKVLCEEYANPSYQYDFKILNALKNTSSGDFKEGFEQLSKLKDFPTKGMIFSRSDLVFYQGFALFYSHKYDQARKYFQRALDLKLAEKPDNQELEQESLRQLLFGEDENEEEEIVIGQTFTKIETIYNIGICYLLENNYEKAIEYFERMV